MMGSNDISAHVYERVVSIISKPPSRRTDLEISQILSWFKKKSDLFKQLKDEIIQDIVKNCEFETDEKDDVIIQQGDKGECFFIILGGSVSIYINTNLGIEEDLPNNFTESEETARSKCSSSRSRNKPLDRSIYGNYVGKIDAGRSFGELALINTDCVRNATIIANEKTDLVIVNRDLYNRSLHEFQAKDFEDRKRFVENHAMFKNWLPKYKKQMAMSLRREKVVFDSYLVRQGSPVDGVIFLLSGQVKILMDPTLHAVQYPHFFPLADPDDLERDQARESLRKELSITPSRSDERRHWTPITPMSYSSMSTPDSRNKMRSPQMPRHALEVCSLGAFEIIGNALDMFYIKTGDLEAVMDLPTYCYTAICTQGSDVFVLDQKNYDRLIEKRNPKVIDILKKSVREKYKLRLSWLHNKEIPLIRYFLYQLKEEERHKKEKSSSFKISDKDNSHEWNVTNLTKGPLIDMFGPGSVFFVIRMKEKQRQIEKERYQGVKKRMQNHARKPPSTNSTDPTVYSSQNTFISQLGKTSVMEDREIVTNGLPESRNSDRKEEDVFEEESDEPQSRLVCENTPENVTASSSAKSKTFSDPEINEDYLGQLEKRIEAWNNKVAGDSLRKKNNKAVKLPRYVHDGPLKPIPGKKVIIKPIVKKRIDIMETLKQSLEKDDVEVPSVYNQKEAEPSGVEKHEKPSSVDCSVKIIKTTKKTRPLSSNVWNSPPRIIRKKRPTSARKYTAADYEALKLELRRKQQSFKSILGRPTSAFA